MEFLDRFVNGEREEERIAVVESEYDVLSERDQFSMCIAALQFRTEDEFRNFLRVFDYITKYDLLKHLNVSSSDPSGAWNRVVPFLGRSSDELFDALGSSFNLRENDLFRAVKSVLWARGVSSLDLGFGPIFSDIPYPNIKYILNDSDGFCLSAALWKLASMKNVFRSLINIFPVNPRSNNSDMHQRELVMNFMENFESGVVDSNIRKEKFKYPSELGVTLAHTMSPREWITRSVTDFLRSLFGYDDLYLVFNRDNSDVSHFKGDYDFLLCDWSNLHDSPYHLSNHPSLNVGLDQDGFWLWRNAEAEAMKICSFDNSDEDELSLRVLRYLKDEMTVDDSTVDLAEHSEFLLVAGNRIFVKMFRRGYSKSDEVRSNPGFLHIVSSNVASTFSNSLFCKIVLTDYNSVLLIPLSLWSKLSKGSNFSCRYGYVARNLDFGSVRFLVFLCQLAISLAFIKALRSGKFFDIKDYAKDLIAIISNSRDVLSLLGRNVTRSNDTDVFFDRVFDAIIAGSYGIVVGSERSKIGRRSAQRTVSSASYRDVGADMSEYQGETDQSFLKSLLASVNSSGSGTRDFDDDSFYSLNQQSFDNEESYDPSGNESDYDHMSSGDALGDKVLDGFGDDDEQVSRKSGDPDDSIFNV